jgi:N-acetyl-D-muramate 6-phosphate phosphatase
MILFDLDGTLVDTAPDLALALNLQRQKHGLQDLPIDVIRPFASHGSKGLLSIGFGLSDEDDLFNAMRVEYLDLYDEVFTRNPVLFDGVSELLDFIESQSMQWGIVTNKPRRFSAPLIDAMGLAERMTCLVCGDDVDRPKPAPDTLFLACKLADVNPEDCFYVGDAERDIQAGNAAGMKTVVAMYGYLDEKDRPAEWGAHHFIKDVREMIGLINHSAS